LPASLKSTHNITEAAAPEWFKGGRFVSLGDCIMGTVEPTRDRRTVNGLRIDPDSLAIVAGLAGYVLVKAKTLAGEAVTLSACTSRKAADNACAVIQAAGARERINFDGDLVAITFAGKGGAR
jgi:hypothetical protein